MITRVKRRSNLIKKAAELSSLHELDTIVLIRDRKNQNITLFESDVNDFSIEVAVEQLNQIRFKVSREAKKWSIEM